MSLPRPPAPPQRDPGDENDSPYRERRCRACDEVLHFNPGNDTWYCFNRTCRDQFLSQEVD